MKAYKGFNKDMTCKGFQYEVGKTYETNKAECCVSGFHACEMPLDCFHYYKPTDSIYCEVEQDGKISKDISKDIPRDTKNASTKITIGNRLGIKQLIKAQIEFVLNKIKKAENKLESDQEYDNIASSEDKNSILSSGPKSSIALSGHSSQVISSGGVSSIALSGNSCSGVSSGYGNSVAVSGNDSIAMSSGKWSPAVSSGFGGFAIATGEYSCAVAAGRRSSAMTFGNTSIAASAGYVENSAVANNKTAIAVCNGRLSRAKGVLGSHIVLTEWNQNYSELLCVKMVKISGKKYKPDTWYTLRDGKVVPWKDEYWSKI